MITFLQTVDRMLRRNGIYGSDATSIAAFTSTAYDSAITMAKLAVQDELVELVSDRVVPREGHTSGTITTVADTRVYSLPSDFIRFYGHALFRNESKNRWIQEYTGGLEQLQSDIINWDDQTGEPLYWYWEPSTTTARGVGFWQTPNDVYRITYEYEKSVMVQNTTDQLPFNTLEEGYAFAEMAARRFKFMFEAPNNINDLVSILQKDGSYKAAKSRLLQLLKGRNPVLQYGHSYGGR